MRHVQGLLAPIILLSVVAALTIRAWWLWRVTPRRPCRPRWRAVALRSGLVAVSLAFIIFLGIGVYARVSGGLGYNFAPATLWVRADLWLCLAGLALAALGKGPGRGLVVVSALVTLAFWFGLALSA